ncbi:vacuolar protein sorting protein 24 [Emiliania huxleyi CCMP1516]|uniref:Charged multivesicular body protein 3 n=2 Tax=Emiliania huxleyi TaxID=2903 RepID=A0A0D3I739_EMIH1|nr:vacuolar protein sorting protein 24 [Emiliania huxleyi CCMP1516]EOD07074.1 vacuolar protein sorting protein 24 [Emiliania huxleyi CCMP1516]|eukprot:XP_005759503.1 vacuolar protein sorting protein 24 [Emiliania huxleyi CCMP1516]
MFHPPDPREQVNKWKKEMRSESRKLDRQILKIQREEEKIKRSVKEAAKRGDTASCKTYAKEIVRSRKAVTRLHTSKAQMNSVVMQMQNQMSQAKVMGTLTKSADIMKAMNKLVKVEGISETMRNMEQEMTKAGLLEEMMDDAMETFEDEDDEEAADEEVSKVLSEIATQQTGGMAAAPKQAVQAAAKEEEEEEDEESLDLLRARLAALEQC